MSADRATGPLRVALIGAECTGKTSLAMAMARELPGLWLPEILREWCEALGRTPRPHEQAGLMRAQLEREVRGHQEAARADLRWLISDSTPLVTALYSVELFDDASLLPEALAHQRGYDLTLLLEADLPWVADGIQRDGPAVRAGFHARLVATLHAHRVAYVPVGGDEGERLAGALAAARQAYNLRTR